jgi:hypothetical protein
MDRWDQRMQEKAQEKIMAKLLEIGNRHLGVDKD